MPNEPERVFLSEWDAQDGEYIGDNLVSSADLGSSKTKRINNTPPVTNKTWRSG